MSEFIGCQQCECGEWFDSTSGKPHVCLPTLPECPKCGQQVTIGQWFNCPHDWVASQPAAVHQSERAVKFYHPEHGWRTPGEANRPMPERLQQLGFKRVEFSSLKQLQQHEQSTGSRAEVIDYNKNSHLAERAYGKTS